MYLFPVRRFSDGAEGEGEKSALRRFEMVSFGVSRRHPYARHDFDKQRGGDEWRNLVCGDTQLFRGFQCRSDRGHVFESLFQPAFYAHDQFRR